MKLFEDTPAAEPRGLDERLLQSRLVVTLVCWEVARVGREVLVYVLKGRLQCRRNCRSQVM